MTLFNIFKRSNPQNKNITLFPINVTGKIDYLFYYGFLNKKTPFRFNKKDGYIKPCHIEEITKTTLIYYNEYIRNQKKIDDEINLLKKELKSLFEFEFEVVILYGERVYDDKGLTTTIIKKHLPYKVKNY